MNSGNREHFEALDQISPNLKLGKNRVISVLKRVYEGQPDREKVKRAVMEEFENKEAKSVFRGMVVPTLTRLQLIRKDTQPEVATRKKILLLSPNGKLVVAPNKREIQEKNLDLSIRDYAAFEIGLTREDISYLQNNLPEIEKEDRTVARKAARFNKTYLQDLEFELPSKSEISEGRVSSIYSDTELKDYITNNSKQREWFIRSLKKQQMMQIDDARWALMKDLLRRNMYTTTWFVDEAVWREYQSDDKIIDLWKSSVHSPMKLSRNNTSYEGVVLRERDI